MAETSEGDFAAGWARAVDDLETHGLPIAVEEACADGAKEARATHRFRNRTGDAEASIDSGLTRHTGRGVEGRIECSVPYAGPLANGSRAHTIEAKGDKPLRFQVGGQWVYTYSVNHPGTTADPFMDNARNKAEESLVAKAEEAAVDAFVVAGFDL